MEMDLFGEVRSILQEPPSPSSFFRLRGLFEDGSCPEEVFVYIDEHLGRWPPNIPRYIPHMWLPKDGGALPRVASFCNAFVLTDSDTSFEVVRSWLGSEHSRGLSLLGLPRFRIAAEQWQMLGELDALQALDYLDVSGCGLGEEGSAVICSLPFLKGLQTLDVSSNAIGEEGLDALAAVPWSRLETLRTRANSLDAFALGGFVRGEHWSTVRTLDLSNNPIGEDGVERIARARGLASVVSLSFAYCNITSGGLARLTRGDGLRQLESLDLSSTSIEDLSENAHRLERFSKLRELRLHGNRLRAENLAFLLEDGVIPQLEVLDLSVTALGDEGIARIARCDRFESLRELRLAGNRMTADGARALAQATWLSGLEKLDLGLVNDARLDVVEAIANAPLLPEALKQPWRDRHARLLARG